MAENETHGISRRDFIKSAGVAAAAVGALSSTYAGAWAQGRETLRAGLVGCGGRGTGAAMQYLEGNQDVEVIALADLFEDRVKGCQQRLREDKGQNIPDEMCFTGFDAYEKLLATDIDVMLTAAPPYFRPEHFAAAIERGKHVFMEKPLCVDPVGARRIIEAANLADQKGLSVVIGTQRRHQASYVECLQRVRDGAIGDILNMRAYWVGGPVGNVDGDTPTTQEGQIRNWVSFTWLSGDHIVEQHVHNIDVCNWFKGDHPVSAFGFGYRARKTYGDQYDFFCVEFEYADGVRMESKCRQISNCDNDVSEWIVGTEGIANCWGELWDRNGNRIWRWNGEAPSPYVQEHTDLVNAIRSGNPINEAVEVAQSCLTAIMGRESAYSGKRVTWDQMMQSTMVLGPTQLDLNATVHLDPVPQPGIYTTF